MPRFALAELEALDDDTARDACLLPPDALVAAWPAITLGRRSTRAGSSPACAAASALDDAANVRVYGPEPGAFLGTGHVAGGELIASRLLSPAEVAALIARARTVPESLPA